MNNNGSEVKVLFTIGINKDNVVMISGDLNNKKLCYHLLAEAIKVVADYNKPIITRPSLSITHQMLNFVRYLKR